MKQLDLLQGLISFVIAYRTLEAGGTYPVPGLKNALSPKLRKELAETIPGADVALRAYDSGTDLNWEQLSASVAKYALTYAKQPGATASFVKALKAYSVYFKSDSAAALKQIEKQSSSLADPFILSFFTPDTTDQGAIKNELIDLVHSLGGKGETLDQETLKALKTTDPDSVKQYMLLKRQATESWKAAVSAFVRGQSRTTVPYQDVLKHLAKEGYVHTMPAGFTGLMDSTCSPYTLEGDAIAGGLPSKPLFTSVKMNPKPSADSPWVFMAVRSDGTDGNYFYTEKFQRGQAKAKFEKVAAFDAEATRKKWLPTLKGFNALDLTQNTVQEVAALVLEILYRTSNRIGSRIGGNATGGGFGICTLLIAHFYPQTDGKTVKFIYLGKDDVKTVVAIKPTDDAVAKKVCEAVYALARREGAKKKDSLFVTALKNGTFKPLQPSAVNALFSQCAGVPGLTPHKLRTAKGTAIFREFLDTLYTKRPKLNEKQLLDQMKAGATLVGKQLNHVRRSAEGEQTVTPLTSLKNYIDPQTVMEMFDHYQVPYPSFLEKLVVESKVIRARAEKLRQGEVEGPDGKPMNWDAPSREQRQAFKDMTEDEYAAFCERSLDGTEAEIDTALLQQALREGVEGVL